MAISRWFFMVIKRSQKSSISETKKNHQLEQNRSVKIFTQTFVQLFFDEDSEGDPHLDKMDKTEMQQNK